MTAISQAKRTLPRVLVLMATYNGAPWVRTQIDSILAQQDVFVTLSVRDDGSTDETLRAVHEVQTDAGRVSIDRAPEPTGSAAANFFQLMQAADTRDHDFVALSDQDDVWETDKLARAISALAASGADGYSAAVKAFWPDGRTVVLTQRFRPTRADHLFEGVGQGCTFVMRRAFFCRLQHAVRTQAASLRNVHYHDWMIYALCRLWSGQWHYDPWVCMQYRQHASNDTGARAGLNAAMKRLALIRSGWYGRQIVAIAQLCVAVDEDRAVPARLYLRRLEQAQSSLGGRFSLCGFVLRNGRRRLLDRVVLAWAALSGHLSRATY